jgi:hypothetical protein
MAQLDKATFVSKWTALFADNTTRDISEEYQRNFMQDIADSLFNLIDDNDTSVSRDNDASLTLTVPGRYIHYGTEATPTRTMPVGSSGITGRFYVVSNDPTSTGSVNLKDSDDTTTLAYIDPGMTAILYWDGNSKYIMKL